MDSSRRAVESYWRSRMIDGATADEDKVTPVYKLEEICELLRSSRGSIVKEVSEFVLKRLEHKSPVVKQKALRLIKYCIGKTGVEFRREMQRNSAAVRELSHYKGQPDPLKGDALNKAVRETAHEAISAIFAEQDNKPLVSGELNRRIEGFGNTNFMPSEDKKSFLSEVVDLGTSSIKQGLSSFARVNSFENNETGSYRSPNFQRSLTTGDDYTDKYMPVRIPSEGHDRLGISKDAVAGPWNSGGRTELTNGGGSSISNVESKMQEVRLLETIVTVGGVRLQPTREAIQAFLVEAEKCDGLSLSRALESKFQLPQWQVRVKAVCVLESMLRKKNEEPFSTVASYFSENMDILRACSESPQSSLREKANKVLNLLAGEQGASIGGGTSSKMTDVERPGAVQMPDLIDTGDAEDILGADDPSKKGSENLRDGTTQTTAYDLLGDSFGSNLVTEEGKTDGDPFADVLFHSGEGKENDIFAGLAIDNKHISNGNHITADSGPEPFDIFASNAGISQAHGDHKNDINDMITGLSIEENASNTKQKGTSPTEDMFFDLKSHPTRQVSTETLNNPVNSQIAGMSSNAMSPAGSLPMPYALPPGMAYAPTFPLHPGNYEAMASLLAQQQFLATMASLQNYGNMNGQNISVNLDNGTKGGQSSPLPDIFQANFPIQTPSSIVNNRKEETKAFDFISDHLAAARDSKRVG